MSPFGYNETLAAEYYPLSREEATAQGFHWREKDVRDYMPQTTPFSETIGEAQDTIGQEIFACTTCGKNFRIIPQELLFYREHVLPIPRKCPDCRHVERMQLRNPRRLWKRTCMKCGMELQTTYAPDRPETIYCEKCFLETIY
jgi:ribosomal protein L37AE/L43A